MTEETQIAHCYWCGQPHPETSMIRKFLEINEDRMQLYYFCTLEHFQLSCRAASEVHCTACNELYQRDDMTKVTSHVEDVPGETAIVVTCYFCGADFCQDVARVFKVHAAFSKYAPITQALLDDLRQSVHAK